MNIVSVNPGIDEQGAGEVGDIEIREVHRDLDRMTIEITSAGYPYKAMSRAACVEGINRAVERLLAARVLIENGAEDAAWVLDDWPDDKIALEVEDEQDEKQMARFRELMPQMMVAIYTYRGVTGPHPVTPAVTARLCACGCGRPVTSPRPEAKYATGACRVRAHRAGL
jgi:hypothetical protein